MVYITVRQSPQYRQMSLEEFLFNPPPESVGFTSSNILNANITNTRTYEREGASEIFSKCFDELQLVRKLLVFNKSTEELRSKPRQELYHSFRIPKRTGGLRQIDAPQPELMDALNRLKTIFEEDFKALYHTSAFAYVKGRSTVNAIKRHQKNESKWFGKFDLADFFGSTTLDFLMQQLATVFPFSEIIKHSVGKDELRTALELTTLNGGLPQGTPISPLLTNIMMIPIDFKLANALRDYEGQSYVYTRYADDFQISSKYTFDINKIEQLISGILSEFNAPFRVKREKTRYGSSAGRNWNLGIMLNKDNEMTVGHKRKRQLQSMIHNYLRDKRNGVEWDVNDIQVMYGIYNYCHMIEPKVMERILEHIGNKNGVNVLRTIRQDLKN